MPAAAIGAGIGGVGSIASAAGGKAAQKQANAIAQSQLGLQQKQFGLTQQQTGLGNAALAPASNYWNALMQGGQAAQQAVGPYAAQLGQQAQGARQAIQSLTPRGGEQNLALAQNYNSLANNVGRLTAGMQPLAAQSLQQLGGAYLGSGAAMNPTAAISAALQNYGNQQNLAASGASGFGTTLYQAMNKLQNGAGQGIINRQQSIAGVDG